MAFKGNEGEFVSIEDAKRWTSRFQKSKSKEEPNAQFYGSEHIQKILAQKECIGIRVYYGIDDENQKVLILVGVDANENDLSKGLILERGRFCPPHCGRNGLSS